MNFKRIPLTIANRAALLFLIGVHSWATPRPFSTWPVAGQDGVDWVVAAQVDTDHRPGHIRDEEGREGRQAHSEDGHSGLDIDIAGFSAMDRGVSVHAVAPGIVTAVHDGEFDRQMRPSGVCNKTAPRSNSVRLTHNDGISTIYAHLKAHSLQVHLGQKVDAGQMLAQVGSSGCSVQPHLHFEVRGPRGQVLPSLKARLWRKAPDLHPPFSLMATVMRHQSVLSAQDIIAGVIETSPWQPGAPLGVGLSTAGGAVKDTVSLRLLDPHGQLYALKQWQRQSSRPHLFWYWNTWLGTQSGLWTVEVVLNRKLAQTLSLTVEAVDSAKTIENGRL